MFRKHPLASAISTALGTASTLLIAPATALAGEAGKIEEVIVTGSRIVKPDYVSTSPVTTVTSEQLEAINAINLESELRQLPQFLPGATEFINNGNPGAATVNLRGLGSNRTLVLMDGKRLPPYGVSGAVDINLIPPALIERVDVVTGGASAVYGSDAVAGVVNFITKEDFEGLQVDADVSEYDEGDGRTENYAVTAGGKFADDRGSAVVSFGYTQRDPVLQGDRKYSNYNINPVDGVEYDGTFYFYADSILDPSRRIGSSNAGATRGRIRSSTGGFLTRHFTPDGQLISAAALASSPYAGNNTYNYNPYNYFQVKQKRTSAFGSMTYDLTDSVEVYGRIFAVNSDVPTQLAPSAYFGGADPIKVNLDNPFLSEVQRTALIGAYNNEAAFPIAGQPVHGVYDPTAAPGSQLVTVTGLRRRVPELGNRVGVSEMKTVQGTGGVRGDIGDTGWTFDVSAQWGQVSAFSATENDVNKERANAALLALPGVSGPVCVSGGNCVPVNLFTGDGFIYPDTGAPMTGTIDPRALDYIRTSYSSDQTTEAHNAAAVFSGEVPALQLPTAEAPISLAVGVEWNENETDYRPDDVTRYGGAYGQGGTSPPLQGSLDSTEYFIEAYVPVASGMPGIDSLGLDLGYRVSDTNLSGDFDTWKAGFEYAPVPSIRTRVMLQRAVRAPNLGEQFSPAAFGLTEVRTDPCAGTAPLTDATIAAKCLAQGAPQATLGSISPPAAQQAANITGGAVALGVSLAPEEADTFTAGFQFMPEFLPDFAMSVDFYNIEIEGGISSYGAQEILDNCFNNDIAEFCSLVVRNAVGELEGDGFGIVQSVRNLSTIETEGVDYSASYFIEAGPVNVTLGLSGNRTLNSSFQTSSLSPTIECEGVYGDVCGNPTPEDRLTFSANFDWREFSGGIFVRHISEVEAQTREDNPEQLGRSIYLIESIPDYQYVDLSLSWNWKEALRVTFYAQNITDEEVTVVGNIPGANTSMNMYADTYDPLGPKYSLGLSYKF
jgi:iron complex outermembrane recepter protein